MCAARLNSSGGSLLVPPLGGPLRLAELGPLLPHDIFLEGSTWRESSVDIAIAGAAPLALPTLWSDHTAVYLLHQQPAGCMQILQGLCH